VLTEHKANEQIFYGQWLLPMMGQCCEMRMIGQHWANLMMLSGSTSWFIWFKFW